MGRTWVWALAACLSACPAPTTTTVVCQVGAAFCGDRCADTTRDSSNCGACGFACAAGQGCVDSTCVDQLSPCDGGLSSCGGACLDFTTSHDDCGACGHVCAVHEECVSGACKVRCQAGLALCSGLCINLSTSLMNCGACGNFCNLGTPCVGGVCGATPPPPPPPPWCSYPTTACDGGCVDPTNDPNNCGTCGQVCASGQCVQSVCLVPCALSQCGTQCVDLQTSFGNCGACGQSCVNGQECDGGACACQPAFRTCGGSAACLDLATDADNCGTCGTTCDAGMACVASACVPDTGSFGMLGGDAAHTGLNSGEAGVPPLSLAWTAPYSAGVGPPVIEGGRVFSIGNGKLHAFEIASGVELWRYDFGSAWGMGWPAVHDGKVYVASTINYGQSWLRQFDRATGQLGFEVTLTSQWGQFWSPIIVGSSVYVGSGNAGGLCAFDAADSGSQLFSAPVGQQDQWSPAYFSGTLYSYVGGVLRSHDPFDGGVSASANLFTTSPPYSTNTAPVFGASHGYVVAPPRVVGFNPATLAQVWSVSDNYTGYAATAGGVVYVLNSGTLQALDASTGARRWVFTGDNGLSYPPVLAGGYVYVSSQYNVYAIDATTHQQVWTVAGGGRLAIGGGMLFVARDNDASLVAYRLTH